MKDTNLIIGKTNSGKTKGILFKETKKIIEENKNLFILDTRGEYFKTFGSDLKENNYNTYVINLSEPTKSNGWNPLYLPYKYYKNGQMDKCVDCLKSLTLELFKDENPNSDPFWSNTSADYVTGIILTLFKEGNLEEINLGSVGTMLTQASIKHNDKTILKSYLDNVDIMNPIYTLVSSTEFAPPETKGSILSVIRQKLNLLYIKENLLNMLCTNELDLSNINDKTAIIIIGKGIVANMLFDQVLYANNNFNYILDNIDNYSNLLELNELLDNASYNGVKTYVATKDSEKFEYQYGKYSLNKFQNIVNVEGEMKIIEEGNYLDYPIITQKQNKYFNFENFMINK